MTTYLVLAVAGMVVVTFGIRLSFLVFGHRLCFPDWLERALRYVPAAVLTALIVPMALAPHDVVDISAANAYLPGAIAAALVAFWSRHTLAAIVSGFVAYGLWLMAVAGLTHGCLGAVRGVPKTCDTLSAMHLARFYFSYFWFSSACGGREI